MTIPTQFPHTSLLANVAVIFIDIAGYVARTNTLNDKQRVVLLHDIYSIFDDTAAQYNAQIIKYLGDGCLLICSADPSYNPCTQLSQHNSVNQAISFSIAVQQRLRYPSKHAITYGDIMGGYIGINQTQFDVWGEIVDRCARILETTPSNAIYVCHNTIHRHSLPLRVSPHQLTLKDFGDTYVYQIHQ